MAHNVPLRLAQALNFASDGMVPEWIMLVPAGARIAGRDGRWFSNPNPDSVIEAFTANGGEMVIDYEHATEITPHDPNPAAGWIDGLENRDGAIWGHVNWTEKASAMIEGREYRFISPVMWHDPVTMEVRQLASAALTHQPNLDMPALNRRHGRTETIKTPSNNPINGETPMDKQARIALCSKLGLATEASDTAILDAVVDLQDSTAKALNSAKQPSLDKFVPRQDHDLLKDELAKAKNRIEEIDGKEIEGKVDAAIASGKIAPASKGYHLAACKADPAAFDKFVEGAPKLEITEKSGLDESKPGSEGSLSDEDKAMCADLGISEENYAKTNGKKAA